MQTLQTHYNMAVLVKIFLIVVLHLQLLTIVGGAIKKKEVGSIHVNNDQMTEM